MKQYFKEIAGLFLFWLVFFTLLRILFLVSQYFFNYTLTIQEFLLALVYGLYMDISMASYFILLPLGIFFLNRWIHFSKFIYFYSLTLIVLMSAVFAGDNVLYREWGFRLDASAFRYLTEFREATSFVSLQNSLLILFLFAINTAMSIYLFGKFRFQHVYPNKIQLYVINFLMIPLLIIPIRGGLDIIPMNPGKVYFSSRPYPNHVAINAAWNVFHSALKKNTFQEGLNFMDESRAHQLVDSLISGNKPPVDTILIKQRPKILFLLLESFTAKLIHKTVQNIQVTPRLNEWIEKGIYFNNAYASGDRTEIGLAAIFSGFPAQPQSAIVQIPKKTQNLPSIIRQLTQSGYQSSFYYGGDASFANMNTYLYNSSCEKIIDKRSFPSSTYNAKWGVHDHILFETLFEEIKKDTSLFLKICLSLSSHPPYEIPEESYWPEKDEETLFINSAHYTDKHLGILLDKLSQLPIWEDLLIVLVADHGARLPNNDLYHTSQKFKIPLWFGGGAIQTTSKIEQVVSQTDICKSLLFQMGLVTDEYTFSKNIFAKYFQGFAFYAFNNGFGWIDSGGLQVFSLDQKKIILQEGSPSMNIEIGQAYLQKLMLEYNSR